MITFNPSQDRVYNNTPFPSISLNLSQSSIEKAPQVDMFGHVLKKQTFGEATIPCFDLNEIEKAEAFERKVLITRFGDAWKEYGFFAVKAESLTPFINNVYDDMGTYFAMPEDVKRKDDHQNFGQTGYSWEGRETAAGSKVADMKETFFINQEMYNDPSKWPESPETFRGTMSAYHQELSKYVGLALTFLFEYLGEMPCNVEETLKTKNNLMRLAYYRAAKEGDNPLAMRAAAHKDLNAITALPIATAPGLEMFKDNKWIPVVAKEGYIVINTGEQLELWTKGQFKAITHQVNNVDSHKPRYASIFFGSFAPDFILAPNVTAQDFTVSRLIEMGTIAEPEEDLVRHLREVGLLQQAPDSIKEKHPTLF